MVTTYPKQSLNEKTDNNNKILIIAGGAFKTPLKYFSSRINVKELFLILNLHKTFYTIHNGNINDDDENVEELFYKTIYNITTQ